MTQAPRIETGRLALRPQVMSDFPAFADFFASERACFVGGPLDARKSWAAFAADTGHWDLRGFGAWSVERKADGALMGQVALSHPPHFPEAELGWVLYEGFEGQGAASEAAGAALSFAFRTLGWTTAVSYVDPENHRSAAVAERLGARLDPAAKPLDPGDLVYRHPAPEAMQ